MMRRLVQALCFIPCKGQTQLTHNEKGLSEVTAVRMSLLGVLLSMGVEW